MLKSMTGYGRAQAQIDGRDILVEIKSVNSRYLEQNVRIGRNYTYLEEELKSLMKTRVSRGKAEIAVSVTLVEGKKADIRVNDEIVRGYLDAMKAYNETAGDEYYLDPDGCFYGDPDGLHGIEIAAHDLVIDTNICLLALHERDGNSNLRLAA